MKKTLIALAVLGAASTMAFAQSNIQIYGVIDASVVGQKVSGHNPETGVGNDTTIAVKSGFRNGSRWGIKGVEDLGNGYQVGFILEQGFNMDDGTVANGWQNTDGDTGAFNRESKLYVQGNFGQIGFGRLGSLAGGAQSNSMLTGWALGTSYGAGSWTGLAKGNGRLNNAIAYVSPTIDGIKVSAMYSNGTKEDKNKWSYNSHYYGIGAQAAFGESNSSLILESVDNKGTDNDETAYLLHFGTAYNFGVATAMFAYQYNWQDKGNKDHIFGLSALVPAMGGTAKVGARYLLGKDDGVTAGAEDKRRAWTLNAAYEYPLSKRTTVWGYAGYADGDKLLAKSTADGNKINYNGWQAALGMTHNF